MTYYMYAIFITSVPLKPILVYNTMYNNIYVYNTTYYYPFETFTYNTSKFIICEECVSF